MNLWQYIRKLVKWRELELSCGSCVKKWIDQFLMLDNYNRTRVSHSLTLYLGKRFITWVRLISSKILAQSTNIFVSPSLSPNVCVWCIFIQFNYTKIRRVLPLHSLYLIANLQGNVGSQDIIFSKGGKFLWIKLRL